EDGSVRAWDSRGLTVVGHGSDTVWSAAFAKDQALLGGSTRPWSCVIWPVASWPGPSKREKAGSGPWPPDPVAPPPRAGEGGAWALRLNEGERRTWSVAVNAAGTRLAASSTGGIVRMWDLPSGQLLWERQAHAGRVRSMAFNADGGLLLTGGGDGLARLWRFPRRADAGGVCSRAELGPGRCP